MPKFLVRLVVLLLLPSLVLGPAEAAGNLIFTQQAVNPPPLWEGQPHEQPAYAVREEAKEDLHPAAIGFFGPLRYSEVAFQNGKGRSDPRSRLPSTSPVTPDALAARRAAMLNFNRAVTAKWKTYEYLLQRLGKQDLAKLHLAIFGGTNGHAYEVERIVRNYANALPIKIISKEFALSGETIIRHLRKFLESPFPRFSTDRLQLHLGMTPEMLNRNSSLNGARSGFVKGPAWHEPGTQGRPSSASEKPTRGGGRAGPIGPKLAQRSRQTFGHLGSTHEAARDSMGVRIGFSDIAYMGGKGRTSHRDPDIFGIPPEVVASMLAKDYPEELFLMQVCSLVRAAMPQYERFITSRKILIPGAILAVNGAPAHGQKTLEPTDTVEIIYKPDAEPIDLYPFLLKRWVEKHVGEQLDETLDELANRFLLDKTFVAQVLLSVHIKTRGAQLKDLNTIEERIAIKLRFLGMDTPVKIGRISWSDWRKEMGYYTFASMERVDDFLRKHGIKMSPISIREATFIGGLGLPLGDINVLLDEGVQTKEEFLAWMNQPQAQLIARLKLHMTRMRRERMPESARYMLDRLRDARQKVISILAVILIMHGAMARPAPQALHSGA